MKALHSLGFAAEIKDFCNNYKSQRGGLLGDNLEEIIAMSNHDFSYNHYDRTARRLGFSNKITLKEIFNLVLNFPKIIFLTRR